MGCSVIKERKIGGQKMMTGKEGKRKLIASLANTALILSIFVVLFPLSMPNVSAAGTTIYVGSGPGNDSATIQGGVDLAMAGDTVFVYAGTYEELVEINPSWKSITLIGEDKETTIIDGNHTGTVITISASWVNVTGFTQD